MALHGELGALWDRVDDMTAGDLWGYFTQYAYMPRLVSRSVLDDAIRLAIDATLVSGQQFALATGKDEEGHYQGLILPPSSAATPPVVTDNTLVVKWEVAKAQADAEAELAAQQGSGAGGQGDQAVLRGVPSDGEIFTASRHGEPSTIGTRPSPDASVFYLKQGFLKVLNLLLKLLLFS